MMNLPTISKLLPVLLIVATASAIDADEGSSRLPGFRFCTFSAPSSTVDAFCWYPAAAGTGEAMTVDDYVRSALPPGTKSGIETRKALRSIVDQRGGPALDDASIDRILTKSVPARRNARALPERRPVVIVTAGIDTPAYMLSSTCERIAQAGFLVIAVPLAPTDAGTPRGFDTPTLEAAMRRVKTVIRSLDGVENADPSRIALVGWSFGGVVNAAIAMEDPSIDALISLDCGIGYQYGWKLIQEWPGVRRDRVSTPALRIRALAPSRVPRAEGYFELNRGNPKRQVDYVALHHADLATPYGEWARPASSTDVSDSIHAVRNEVVSFLNAVMRDASKA